MFRFFLSNPQPLAEIIEVESRYIREQTTKTVVLVVFQFLLDFIHPV